MQYWRCLNVNFINVIIYLVNGTYHGLDQSVNRPIDFREVQVANNDIWIFGTLVFREAFDKQVHISHSFTMAVCRAYTTKKQTRLSPTIMSNR